MSDPTSFERHRLYEVNNMLLKRLKLLVCVFAGRSGDDQLVEIIEVPNHRGLWPVSPPEFT